MSLIFIDNCECKNCIHNKVCGLKSEKEEIINKISGKADNIVASTDSFKLTFSCVEFERVLIKRECI